MRLTVIFDAFLQPRAPFRAAFLGALPLALALSCGSSDEDDPPPPPGPVAMQIGKLLPRGSEIWKPRDPEPVVIGCDHNLGVTVFVYRPGTQPDPDPADPDPETAPDAAGKPVKLPPHQDGDWLFRAPGTCGREQCGTLAVTVQPVGGGPSARAEVALDTAIVDLAPLGPNFTGRVRLLAELLEDGEKVANYKGLLLSHEIELDLAPDDCAPDGEGGAGGAPSTGGTGGTGGSTGGTAGSTGGTGDVGGMGGMGGVPGAAGDGSGGA